jgi:hypothetical protein
MKFYFGWLVIVLIGISPLLISSADAAPDRKNLQPQDPLSPGLAEALTASLQENLPAVYHPKSKSGCVQALNQAHRMNLTFTATGPHVRDVEGDWTWEMSLVRFGREGYLKPVPAASVVCDKGRVEYRRGPNLTEWYLNTALGVEQGFTISQRPATSEHRFSPLVLDIRLSGAVQPVLEQYDYGGDTGTYLLLHDNSGNTLFRYTGLLAYDANGKRLPARLALSGDILSIVVNDKDASYPVVVDPWLQRGRLTAIGGAAGDRFGYAVAMVCNTAVVGARHIGAAWVFQLTGNRWIQVAELTTDDLLGGFGSAVAVDGDIIVVGAPDQDKVFLFVKPASGWVNMSQTATFTTSDGGASFGWSVGVSGDTVVAGARLDDSGGSMVDRGSAYIFTKPPAGWADMTQTAKLTPSDGEPGDEFGISVGISGDTIVVGAPYSDYETLSNAGGAYIFEKGAGPWANSTETVRLRPYANGAGAQFGNAVAINGDTVVVGAWLGDANAMVNSGSAFVFEEPQAGWSTANLSNATLTAENGEAFDAFGISVAINGDIVVVGVDEGMAYVFEKPEDAGVWSNMTETAELRGSGREPDDSFGLSVAVSGYTALVGAMSDDVGANANQGTVYLFVRGPAQTGWLPLLLLGDD